MSETATALGIIRSQTVSKPTLCLDFDGVIHSYSSGWQGPSKIPDDPVPGALMFLRDALDHFEVSIYSSRSGMPDGIAAMKNYLRRQVEASFPEDEIGWIEQIQWPTVKPPAFVTIDDRAITFTGQWPSFAELLAFKPWNKR